MTDIPYNFKSNGADRVAADIASINRTLTEMSKQVQAATRAANDLAKGLQGTAKGRVSDEFKRQAAAAKEKAAADRAAKIEAEKLFQTNAKLTQQRVREELAAQAAAARELQQGYALLATGAGAFATAIGGIFTNATQEFLEYERAVKQAGVISGSLGTENFTALTEEIRQLGIETTKTPGAIAEVSVQLSRAGFSAVETTEALEGIVKASEATGDSLEITGDIISKTIRSFQLATSDSLAVSDALVATANNTNTSIQGLGESLKFVAPAAQANNQSLEDTLVILGLLGDAGLQGGNAGRNLASALRQISIASAASESELSGLVRGSARAAQALKTIGVNARNSDGTLRPLTELFPQISGELDKLSEQDQAILVQALFGTEGGRVATNLINVLRETPERLDLVSEAINNAGGASQLASEQLRSGLTGALDLLDGSIATVNNTIGGFVATGLTPLVLAANEVVKVFLGLPAPIQAALIGFTGFVGVLSAAVAAIAAYNAVNGSLLLSQLASAAAATKATLAIAANTAAKGLNSAATTKLNAAELASASIKKLSIALNKSQAAAQVAFAIATGKADAATRAQASSFLSATASARTFALQLGAFAGAAFAIAAVGAAINDVGAIAARNQQAVKDLQQSVREYNEELALSADAAEEGLGGLAKVAADNEEAIRNSISGISKLVDVLIRAFDLISDFDLGDYLTIEDRAVIEAQAQFFDVVGSIEEDVIPAFEELKSVQGGLTNASQEDLERFKALLETATSGLNNSTVATENDLKVKGQYQRLLGEINDALNGTTTSTVEDTEATEDNTQAVEDNLKAQRDRAKELLNQQFANNQRGQEQDFGDAQRIADQAFQDQARAEEQAFQDEQRRLDAEFADQQQAEEERFNAAQSQRDEQFAQRIQAREAEFNDREQASQEAFQRSQQQREAQFNDQQRDAEERFQAAIEARRAAAQDRFDARQQSIDRQLQLEFAGDPEERDRLEAQFEQEDRIARRRAQLEADLQADRQRLEEELRAEEEAFQAEQQAAQINFQKELQGTAQAFEAQLAAQRQAFEAQIQASQQAFDLQQQNLERAFQAEQEARQAAFEEATRQSERAFADQQRADERAFQEAQRQEERAFQESQRREEAAFKERERILDQASAEQVALIIRNARAQQAEGTGTPTPIAGARREGGPVEGGKIYRVGEAGPELFVSPANGYILRHSEAQAIARTAAPPIARIGAGVDGDRTLLKEVSALHKTIKGLNQGGRGRPVTQNFYSDQDDYFKRRLGIV